jgi:hypothetical protein
MPMVLGVFKLVASGGRMGKKSSPRDVELYQRVDEVLHYIWDPIGVAGMPMARDEYYAYLPTVFSLLTQDGGDDEKIAEYLIYVATERMGLRETKERALEIAAILQDWKAAIDDRRM